MIIAQSLSMQAPSAVQSSALQVAADAYNLSALISGASVATWANNGVVGTSLIASGGAQPTYFPTAFNGRPAVQFLNDDYLTCDAAASAFSGSDVPFTFISVIKSTNDLPTECQMSLGHTTTNAYHLIYKARHLRRDNVPTAITPAGPALTYLNRPTIMVHRFSGTEGRIRRDGELLQTVALDVGTCTFNTFTIGAVRRATGILNTFLNAYVAEFALWNVMLSDDEVLQVTNYLNQKWFS
jgi:hypothetical protein